LLFQLGGKVSIAGAKDGKAAENAPFTSRLGILDGAVAYVRISGIEKGVAEELRGAWRELSATNKIKGLVLDLRFANGEDYKAAAAVADLFLAKERELLDWGEGSARSKGRSDAITLPVAVLVNRRTSGAAEALAAVMRETGVGLILGAPTAGKAMIAKQFPLSNGQRLLIATDPVKLGNGTALSAQGVKPDIEVTVSPPAERAYFEDAYAVIGGDPGSGNVDSNQTAQISRSSRRQRVSEADLVRERREGVTNGDTDLPPGVERAANDERPPNQAIIRDPVLARAVDVLKGLAVVRSSRS
jgi:hypothetical protein